MSRSYNSFVRLGEGIYQFSRGGTSVSQQHGPSVTILGGVHGNERIGVLVLDALRLALLGVGANHNPLLNNGAKVTLVYANQQALRTGKRGAQPHADLNRCFSKEILGESSVALYEHVRARELAPILKDTNVLVDLHSTNKPSLPFVRIAGHVNGLPKGLVRIAARLPCEILLHDPRYLLADGNVALTDEFVGANGGLGICYESGVATDLSKEKVDGILSSVWRILTRDTQAVGDGVGVGADVFAEEEDATADKSFDHVYELTRVFKLTDAGFRWAPGVGDANFQRVPAAQPIGFVGNQPFAVDDEAFIVFPKVPELWKLGAPLGWLARRKVTSGFTNH